MSRTLLGFPEKDVMCLDHFRSSFNNTPRQEIHSTGSSRIPQRMYFLCGGTFLVEIHISCIEGLNTVCHLRCHISSCRRSSCSWSPSSSLEMTLYTNAPSGKNLIEDLRQSGSQFTQSGNSNGSKTIPCRTPDVTGEGLQQSPSQAPD